MRIWQCTAVLDKGPEYRILYFVRVAFWELPLLNVSLLRTDNIEASLLSERGYEDNSTGCDFVNDPTSACRS
jgi:hypothetical protein